MKEEIQAMFENYPNFKDCSIQTFDDDKKRKDSGLARIYKNEEKTYELLDNRQSKGAGVFFSVNCMEEGKRDKESVNKVNVWVCEVDNLDKESQIKLLNNCPIYPSLIIESNSSYHLYRYAKDGTKENRTKITYGLRNYFDGDEKVAGDISRVLRLPGYKHLKDINNPFEITIYGGNMEYYTEEQMFKAYPDSRSLTDIKRIIKEKEIIATKEIGGDYFWARARSMNTRNMLEELSGDKLINGDVVSFQKNTNGTEQIWVNGVSTSCRLRNDGSIGSESGGPYRTSWVFWYNRTGSEVAKWIRDKHPEMCESKNIENKQEPIIDIEQERLENFKKMENVNKAYQSGKTIDFMVDTLNRTIGKIIPNEISIIVGAPNSGKTTFAYLMMKHNLKRGLKVGFMSYEMKFGEILEQYYFWKIGAMDRFANAQITDEDNEKTKEYKRELIMDTNFFHCENLKASLESLKQDIEKMIVFGADVVFIDNLVKIRRTNNEFQDNTEVIEYLYRISKERGLTIVLLHHTDKTASIKNILSFRGTGDIQIKPDNLFYIKRPGLGLEGEQLTDSEKAELLVQRRKQRLGKSMIGEAEIYFYKGEYYGIEDYMKVIQKF